MSNACEQCGGVKEYYYSVEVVSGPIQPNPNMLKVCWCKPEPHQHDGWLDEDGNGLAELNVKERRVLIEVGKSLLDSTCIRLDANQALSLLAWLKQEQDTLETLAEEQERG